MQITLEIDQRKKGVEDFLKFISTLSFVKKVEIEEKSPYNPEFLAKIRRAEKQKSIKVNPHDVWGSLGLK